MKRISTKGPRKTRSDIRFSGLGNTMGSATGEIERAIEPGGWAGTDDATSTALSDQIGNPPLPEEEKPLHTINRDFDESIELDEQRQEEAAKNAEEATELMILAEQRAKRILPN
jgi:hypothetical protein